MNPLPLRATLLILLFGCLGLLACDKTNQAAHSSDNLYRAWQEQRSDIQLSGSGTVTRVLADDMKGSRHQRFILRIDDRQTLLIAHNIDLAPRLVNLRRGDLVEFYGEYQWNKKGGVIHWTHKDPKGRHPDGWLRHRGQRYW